MGKCIICDRYTKNEYLFCKECYQETKNIFDEYFDEYDNEYELRNDYFNMRKECLTYNINERRLNNFLMTMYALSDLNSFKFNSDYLIDRVESDINEIIDNKTDSKNIDKININSTQIFTTSTFSKFDDKDYRKQWPNNVQCEDGHYVRSKAEKIIDDWLYHHNIVHAYEKSVYMKTNPNDVILSDFYIPKGDVYIEYWGMSGQDNYDKRKKYKISLYDKNNYNRIDLDESHINRIDDILPRYLGKYNIN